MLGVLYFLKIESIYTHLPLEPQCDDDDDNDNGNDEFILILIKINK